jgi:hypothetical protein
MRRRNYSEALSALVPGLFVILTDDQRLPRRVFGFWMMLARCARRTSPEVVNIRDLPTVSESRAASLEGFSLGTDADRVAD